MQKPVAVIADTDRSECAQIAAVLSSIPGEVVVLGSMEAVLARSVRAHACLLVLGGTAALVDRLAEGIRRLRSENPQLPVILVMRGGSEQTVVAAFRAGVSDYFGDPLDVYALAETAAHLMRRCEAHRAKRASGCPARQPDLIGDSEVIRHVCAALNRVASTDSTLLITGETGTGKELAALHVHESSARRDRPFVSVNCAAIPDSLLESELFGYQRGAFTGAAAAHAGLLQQAHGGTLFLDEVGDMSALAQAKVLRAIETREVVPLGGRHAVPLDIRIIAATNQDLERATRDRHFRQDLYFRLSVVRITLPPLRERRSDIPMLLAYYADHFARRFCTTPVRFTADACQSLARYAWPGNVRELKNLVEAEFARCAGRAIDVTDLPEHVVAAIPSHARETERERARLVTALLEARWNKSRAARQLRCSRMTLYRRMRRLGVASERDS